MGKVDPDEVDKAPFRQPDRGPGNEIESAEEGAIVADAEEGMPEDSDEWISDIDNEAGIIRDVQDKWTLEIDEKLCVIEETTLREEYEWMASFM